MKKIIILLICSLAFVNLQAQAPVKWMATYQAFSATEGEITVIALIEKNHHIYSQRPTEAGPISTTFTFPASKQYELVGKNEETNVHETFDPAFGEKLFSFDDKAEFRQKIKIKGKSGFSLPFKVEYTCCNDKMCLPPTTIDLNVKIQ